MKYLLVKYLIVFLQIGVLTSHLNGQISFNQEIGYNNYNFNEINPVRSYNLNLENALEGLYFGFRIDKKLDESISVGVVAH